MLRLKNFLLEGIGPEILARLVRDEAFMPTIRGGPGSSRKALAALRCITLWVTTRRTPIMPLSRFVDGLEGNLDSGSGCSG